MIARKQRWLAMDASGDVVDMDDFDEDEVSDFLDGKCFALAYASHRLTGWTIEGKIERLGLDTTLDIDPASAQEYEGNSRILAPKRRADDVDGTSSTHEKI